MNEKELTFRGGFVRNVFTSGAFWERLVVRPGSATLEPWLGKAVTIVRNDVEAVEFVKVRLPFVWRTLVRFRCVDGSVERRMFVPARTGRVRKAFISLNWPVRHLNWREEASAKLRGRAT